MARSIGASPDLRKGRGPARSRVASSRAGCADHYRWKRPGSAPTIDVCDEYPKSGGAPEACYWAGVAAYKDTNDPQHLGATGELLKTRYPDSE